MKTIFPAEYVQGLLDAIRERWMAIGDREIWNAVHRDCVADLCQQNCSARSYLAAALLERESFEWRNERVGPVRFSRIIGPQSFVSERTGEEHEFILTDQSVHPEEPSVTILPEHVTIHYYRVTYLGTEQVESVFDRCTPGSYTFERRQEVVGKKMHSNPL